MKYQLRIALLVNVPVNDPIYLYIESLDEANTILQRGYEHKQFQSDGYNISGLKNVAVLERYDSASDDWVSVPLPL